MKILVLASTVPASADDPVPRFVLEQSLALAEADPDLTITILAPHTPASRALAWPRDERPDGRVRQVRFRYAPRRIEDLTVGGILPRLRAAPSRALAVPLLLVASARTATRFAKALAPDLIYAHWFTPQVLSAARASRRTGTPFGFTTHAMDAAVWRRFGGLGARIVRRATRRATFMTAVSRQTAAKLTSFFDAPEREEIEARLAIIPMGVDLPAAAPVPANPLHVAVVARLVEKKGISVLLDAWPGIREAHPDAELTIAGDGPLADDLRSRALRAGGSIRFPGYVTGAAKDEVLAAAGVVVVPSVVGTDGDQDGLPVALLEGLALGKIVVASDASGGQELIADGVSGFIVAAGDVAALRAAVLRAMGMGAGERAAMAAAAREVAASVAWPAIAARHLALMRA